MKRRMMTTLLLLCAVTGFAQTVFQLAREGSAAEVITLMGAQGVEILDLIDENGYRPLEITVLSGNRAASGAMIRFAPDTGARKRLDNLFLLAVYGNRRDEITALLNAGADINVQSYGGQSALMISIMSDPTAHLTAYLLRSGAIDSLSDNFGREAFHYAGIIKNENAWKILTAYGAYPLRKDRSGRSAIHYLTGEDPEPELTEKVEETPVEIPTDEVEETAAETTTDEVEETAAETPTDEVEETPVEEAEDEVEETPAEITTEQVAETPVETKTEEVEETPVETTTEQVEETSVEVTTEQVAEIPVETTTDEVEETSVEITTEQVAEIPVETTTDEVEETPVEVTTEQVEETPVETTTDEVEETPVETTTDEVEETPVETTTEQVEETSVETKTGDVEVAVIAPLSEDALMEAEFAAREKEIALNLDFLESVQYGRSLEAVSSYLDQGANVNVVDEYQRSALMIAAIDWNRTDLTSLLIERGADVSWVDANGEDTLSQAVKHPDYSEIVQLLIDAGAFSSYSENSFSLFWNAFLLEGNQKSFALLLEQAGEADIRDSDGKTVLQTLLYNFLPERVPYIIQLIDAGADLNAVDSDGWSVLTYAAKWCDSAEVIKLLIERGADLTLKDASGATPFISAVQNGSLDVILTFLESGASVKEMDSNNFLPSFYFFQRDDLILNQEEGDSEKYAAIEAYFESASE